jgi:5-methylcytosine-specific restriction protein A
MMDTEAFYRSQEWTDLRNRVLARDGRRCSVGSLLGGGCSTRLHVHHLQPLGKRPDLALDEKNLVTVCSRHHPMLEAFRLFVERTRRTLPPCPHNHPYPAGRLECDRRRAKKLGIVLDDVAA